MHPYGIYELVTLLMRSLMCKIQKSETFPGSIPTANVQEEHKPRTLWPAVALCSASVSLPARAVTLPPAPGWQAGVHIRDGKSQPILALVLDSITSDPKV